ncbi:MAG: tRNA 2-thiouridine(34) synthase MnmA [Planctomycetota bacterium]|jgi:tRNA-specific 2-thiouridylase
MKLFAAMSGGVDSAVAALLLRRAGHDVVGIHLRTGVKGDPAAPGERPRCCGTDEAADARRVCSLLDIPFYVQNTERDFSALIGRFADSYAEGATPNPCIACNTDIKFGALLERARALGAEAVATGHYARRIQQPDGSWALARARDANKDQSYVLYGLTQAELGAVRFPLGDLTKAEVRAHAREAGLPVAEKLESQEICFVPGGDYRAVVRERRPDAFVPGEIVDLQGDVLGRHEGVGAFTVGQRKGLGLAVPEPLYVLRIEPGSARVVVGPRSQVGVTEAWADNVVWTSIQPPTEPFKALAMLRYRSIPVPATVHPQKGARARLSFDQPAWPVTPGQAAVFYSADQVPNHVLGGGTLART